MNKTLHAHPLSPTPQSHCFVGHPTSGKTEQMLERTEHLLAEGAQASEILVVGASPQAVSDLAGHLPEVGAKTVQALALEILRKPQARAFTGRPARVLTEVEERFLAEDMQTSSLKRKLRMKMESYLRQCLSMMYDADPDWAIGEELGYLELFQANLAFAGGMVEEEVSNFAVHYLEHAGLGAFAYKHVLVDDYHALSRASQVLVNLLAQESIAISYDPMPSGRIYERYPWARGVEEFLALNPQTVVHELKDSRLPDAIAAALGRVEGIRAQDDRVEETEDGRDAIIAEWADCAEEVAGASAAATSAADTPDEPIAFATLNNVGRELSCICDLVADAIEGGVAPDRIFVTCASGAWRSQAKRALEKRGIACRTSSHKGAVLKGDLRDEGAYRRAREETIEHLRADADDGPAWRCWIGFGDYLGNSVAVSNLRTAAMGMSLVEALEALDAQDYRHLAEDCNPSEFDDVLQSYRAGKAILAQPVDSTAPRETETADEEDAVFVGSLEEAYGRTFDLVVLGGFVNGYLPSRSYFDRSSLAADARRRMQNRDLEQIYAVLGSVARRIVFTGFEKATLEFAETQNLSIRRIMAKDGQRICALEPSIYAGLFA